ncbi:MAG: PAS domain S-box protein, partial [Methanocalculus sp. MSAO_Arc1]
MGLPGSPDTSISLLYVDDEPALLEIARLYLEKSDQFSVTTCESATDALNLLSTTSFDAIISDYQMPEMDGIRFLTRLRENGVDIPFIIFTGKGREEVVIQALNEGADFYLQKGGDPKAQFAELVNKVRYAVSKRRSEEALRESEERYRTVVEVQDEFICRFLPDGTHIFANDAYCRYFGFDCNGIVGRKFLPPIHPEDREKVSRLYGSLTPDQPSGSMKQRILGQDGRVLWQRLHTTAFFDNHGHPCEYQTVGHDITDLMERDAELRRVNDEFSAANEQLTAAEEELRHQVEELAAARQEIEANSEQLHLAMDAGEHGFWDWDLTTNNAYFSPRYYTMLGYEPDEFPAGFDSWLSLLHPEDAGTVVPHIEASVREMQPFEEEFRMRCKDGSWRWISGRGKAYRSASRGGPSRALGVHVDIDDRKRAELELRKKNEELAATNSRLAESRQEIQRLFSTMLDGFAHHEIICDENGRPVDYRFLAVNPAFERMTGLKSGDIIGKTVREVLPQTEAYWIETFGRVALFGEEITFEQYASEQDSYFLVNAFSPAKNQFACSFMDITDRVAALEAEKDARQALSVANEQLAAAEEELRSQYEELSVAEEELRSQLDEMTALQKALQRSEAGFRTLAETAPVGIALLGADGRPVYFSPKFVELFGYTHNDLVTVDDWFTSAYPEASLRELARKDWNDALDQAKCNGSETRTLEYPVRCKDGGIRQIEFRAARAGEQTVVLFADVTERKAAEDALLASRRELNLILDTMPVGVTYIDPDYRIRYSNHQSALSSDKQPHEVTGLHCYLVRHGRSTRCDDCIIEKAMETGQVEEGFRLLPGGKVFHLKGCPVYDAGGNLTGAIEFGMDVTEQQRIEDTLRESEEKYRTLFAIMEPGVFYQQADGSLVDANP